MLFQPGLSFVQIHTVVEILKESQQMTGFILSPLPSQVSSPNILVWFLQDEIRAKSLLLLEH